MTDPRTEAAREWVLERINEHRRVRGRLGPVDRIESTQILALLDYIVDMEKRLEQWQDYIKAEIERADNEGRLCQ